MIQSVQQSKYAFVTQSISLMRDLYPETTHMIAFEQKKEDISMCSDDIIVNCTFNFTSDEKRVIGQFNIQTVQELIKHKRISKRDKQRCAECLAYVCEYVEVRGFEPVNGYNTIQLGQYAINVRILSDGKIKYCKSWGKIKTSEFTTIGF